MNTTWKTSAFSKNSTPVELDDALLNEKVVILLQGKNVYGDQIFTYLQLSLRSLQQLRDKMRKGDDFMPAEYGTVLAAGKGEPSAEIALRNGGDAQYDRRAAPQNCCCPGGVCSAPAQALGRLVTAINDFFTSLL